MEKTVCNTVTVKWHCVIQHMVAKRVRHLSPLWNEQIKRKKMSHCMQLHKIHRNKQAIVNGTIWFKRQILMILLTCIVQWTSTCERSFIWTNFINFCLKNVLCLVLSKFVFYIMVKTQLNQEAHEPHRLSEKPVKIHKQICTKLWLYHNVDLERGKNNHLLF